MNKAIFKDPLFWAGALALSFSLFQLASQHITLPTFSSAGSIKTFDTASSTPRKVKASQATIDMLQQVKSYQPPAQAQAQKIQAIKKSRPKNSDSIWRVGTSDLADSNDLAAVMANLVEGDSIELEAGSYELRFQSYLDKLTIEGLEGADVAISVNDGGSFRELPKNLKISNVSFDYSQTSSSPWISGWGKTIELENVRMKGNQRTQFYLNDDVIVKIKNSTIKGIGFYLSSSSKAILEDVALSQVSTTAFRLTDSSELKLKNVKLSQVDSGVSFARGESKFEAENLEITEAREAFYASKEVSRRIDIKNGKFSKLRKVLFGDNLRLSCEPCSQEQITSPY